MTHLIANDVVNLRNPFNRDVELSDRYLSKSYTESEQEIIRASDSQVETMWLIWSCKEALFKILTKLYGTVKFDPTTIEVIFSDTNLLVGERVFHSVIRWQDVQLKGISTIKGRAISTVTASTQQALDHVYSNFQDFGEDIDESSAVRSFLFEHLAASTPLNLPQLKIVKSKLGVPKLLVDGRRSAIDISFSHDYGLVGFAMLSPVKSPSFS